MPNNYDVSSFLKRIAQIESSGGFNTNHPEMKAGLHKGTSAIGEYGLMPKTAQEMLNRKRLRGQLPTHEAELLKSSLPDFTNKVKESPELQRSVAEFMANFVLDKHQGNEDAAAYSWNMGHNIPVERITPEELDNNEYVQKYRNLKNILAKE